MFPTGHESSDEMLSEISALVMNILLGGYIYIYSLFNPRIFRLVTL
jgi:hypothetical protein